MITLARLIGRLMNIIPIPLNPLTMKIPATIPVKDRKKTINAGI